MVHSLLDTDFYKLTMMQVVLHKYASAWVRYAFKWRNWDEMHLKGSLETFKRPSWRIWFPSIFSNLTLLNTSDCFNSTETILRHPSKRIS
jgi:hypothetical protein